MNPTKARLITLTMLLTFLLSSCFDKTYKVDNFSNEELKWFKPFAKADTVVFISEKTELDTIIFHKTISQSDSVRSFEIGFYNTNYLTVPYEFTKNSYHQFAIMGDGKTRYTQDILSISKESSGNGSFEFIFIGTIYSGENFKNIQKLNDSCYFFDSNKATYSEMNVEKGIKNFTFDIEKGIIKYTDDRYVKWKRKSAHLPEEF
jgi:hypothetical protein